MALGMKPGDEIITHANTFFATAEAIWMAGGKAILVDCDETTRCIDPKAIAAAITPKTKAIIPVHLYGQCAPMREIRKIADQHKLFVIEDNAQAIDARGDDFRIGELSDAVTTSFIIQKNLGTFGDGGAVVHRQRPGRRDRPQAAQPRLDEARPPQLRLQQPPRRRPRRRPQRQAEAHHGVDRPAHQVGGPLRRRAQGRPLHHAAVRAAGLPPRVPPLRDRDEERRRPRPAARRTSNGKGIDAKTHYSIPIHKQEGYPWGKDAEIRGSLANAEKNAASCISLPMFGELTADEVDCVIDAVRSWKK